MKRNTVKLIFRTVLICCIVSTVSCKKIFDVTPQDQVDAANMYRNVFDANAAVVGIYGKFMQIADKYIVLNELQGDLMSPTTNADQWLRQINTHSVTTDNPWADPRPWYNIILNCNDVMYNFDKMVADGRMTSTDYQQRYSDVGAIRCWVYLQLGITFGSVPYVTDPLSTVDDLKDASKYPKITFDQLLTNLVNFMGDSKRFLDVYPATSTTTGATNTSLNTTVDGYPTNLFFINKRMFLGDLYLWKGNFTKASEQYIYLMDTGFRNNPLGSPGFGNLSFWQYKMSDEPDYQVAYTNAQDERTLTKTTTTGWQSMFSRPTQDTPANAEWIWTIPFDKNYVPVNPFINLFSNQGGSYLLTASLNAMDMWNAQTQKNGFPYDVRGRLSVNTINGQPVIMKQLYYYLDFNTNVPINLLQKQGRWLLYRNGMLTLHFAESACNDNQVKIAYAQISTGMKTLYNTTPTPTDVTNTQQTFQPAPYNLDARQGETPYYRSPWYRETGERERANLVALDPNLYLNNNKIGMEDAIVTEDALELAFEGDRWPTLMRVALRRGPSYLADRVYAKLLRDGNPEASAVRTKLMNTANWYLPFKL